MADVKNATALSEKPLFFAIDVEKKGPALDDPVIEVGIAWGTSLTDIQKRTICLDYKSVPFEEKCYREHWKGKEEILARIEKDAVPPRRGGRRSLT